MKNTKAKDTPKIEWVKGNLPCEWAGKIGGRCAFAIANTGTLYLLDGDCFELGTYSQPRSAKRGAERFAKRMREIFA